MEMPKAELVDVMALLKSGVFGSAPPHFKTIERWARQGILPSYKVGRLRRYDPREIAGIIRNKYRVAAFHE